MKEFKMQMRHISPPREGEPHDMGVVQAESAQEAIDKSLRGVLAGRVWAWGEPREELHQGTIVAVV